MTNDEILVMVNAINDKLLRELQSTVSEYIDKNNITLTNLAFCKLNFNLAVALSTALFVSSWDNFDEIDREGKLKMLEVFINTLTEEVHSLIN